MNEPEPAGDRSTATEGLDAHLVVDRGDFRLDLRLHVAPGETVALLGPNGAGKTTALRALAGLQILTDGHIALNGENLDQPGTRGAQRPRWVPPEHRRIGVVFQDYLLFPHLNAIDNVAFGPRRRGTGRAEARALAAGWLDRVGLGEFGKRRPGQLSGGQAQRVALARALATDPALLLLDEPLAALDARTRLDTRVELHRHLAVHAGAAVLVTHDPVDALMLADRLVVVEEGRAVQEGDAEAVTARPRTDYIARLVGLNLYRGTASGTTVRLASGAALTTGEALEGEAFAAFSPSAVALFREEPDGSPRNTWRATVSGVHRHGDHLRVQLDGPLRTAADVTPAAAAHLGLEPGQTVWAAVKATEIRAYPA
ncbi:ABC transporter ATP-binding protein [Glycomyces harbinensis]|uniref:Molybdate transport system ATP-binding protein n=1 Tax=Glycomyces harbinensis TaxID=58114 RepID=A0A1G6VPG5_9ACTN|nr:ABC transporter ATP-binding protein [Glycomyces harbinensis]SDD55449.1 molybdate transport system ATP-binding protein [Glycomyces harbinensis]